MLQINKILRSSFISLILILVVVAIAPAKAFAEDGDICKINSSSAASDGNFLGFPKWYRYLEEGRKVGDQCLPS